MVVREDKRTWAIIDAKYYRASSPLNAPGWHDLIKQLFYKKAAEEICGEDIKVTLHFIFPGSSNSLMLAKVGDRGQGTISIESFTALEEYGEVVCHYCDPIVLIKKFVSAKKLEVTKGEEISGAIF